MPSHSSSAAGESNNKKLAVKGLSAYYLTERGPVKAVDAVNFALSESESLGIVGESACGKSTLGSALMRSMQSPGRIVGGAIVLAGEDIARMSDRDFGKNVRWKKIAMVFQGAMNALDPVYTVESQLRELLQEHGFEGDVDAKISESLKQVGLAPAVASRYPHELSGGMKQRVVIAMALLLEPDLLVADEPTTALDVLVQSQIIALLKKLHREKGVTVILISHDLALVSQIADKIGIMYAGQLVEAGSTQDIYKNPKHPYTQALIAAVPRLHSDEKKIRFIPGSPPSLLDPPAGCRFYPRCPHAMDVCKQDPPEFATDTGYVRCWLYDPTLKSTSR
ncbi:oligopeptide/dipeptide ABC transporter, ATP-binding protein [Candidatus Nitrososphaera evergladensis SR1]|uniref:Oligopeptide/dipeptide ABC transporter, ATP-binding protein n=1 Tax=Candidatus Nitrososphaera evergladensis SR1 TaxID=1459636 RepID=A0A075MRN8_9ARCH|nr:ABC transporter ATP-binding protein [Candidatus Nitrososphaera evergladensis]AIF83735.1 oligopeptide/dipeptide ABC transporter, ATP-binding protein [Candidatus Nitrososphaera evergladensis SR1]